MIWEIKVHMLKNPRDFFEFSLAEYSIVLLFHNFSNDQLVMVDTGHSISSTVHSFYSPLSIDQRKPQNYQVYWVQNCQGLYEYRPVLNSMAKNLCRSAHKSQMKGGRIGEIAGGAKEGHVVYIIPDHSKG